MWTRLDLDFSCDEDMMHCGIEKEEDYGEHGLGLKDLSITATAV